MRRPLAALAILALAACRSPFHSGRNAYEDGMSRLRYDPPSAREVFEKAEARLAFALADPDLKPRYRIPAVATRIRCLIELDRHKEAADLAAVKVEGYEPDHPYEGDAVGLELLRAYSLDPQRGLAQILVAQKIAGTHKSRLHLAWEEVLFMERMATAQSRAQAIKICEQHAGKIDFDERKKRLSAP
jgi:hypothetical protein